MPIPELASRLRTRVPKEAFAAFDDRRRNLWIEVFAMVRDRPDARTGLVEVILS